MEILKHPDIWFLPGIIGSLIFMVYYFFDGQELSRHGVRVEGTVTDYWTEEHDSGDPDDTGTTTTRYLKAFFTDEEEFVHSVKISVSRKVYKQGVKTMTVKLVHPPGKPKKAKSDQTSEIYSNTIIWGVVMLTFTAAYWFF